MKLIIEDVHELDSSIEDEINEASGQTERNYYLSGICSTPEKKNRNGRVYPRHIWEREVAAYQKEIKEKTVYSLGEWQHPPRSTVDPMKAVIRITELAFKDDGNVWVKAKILNNNTDETNRLKGLIKEGIKIGISTRGVGKVSNTGIVEEYKLVTADLVDMPSDYNALLNGVVEGYTFENGIMVDKEFEIQENGCIGEVCDMPLAENKNEKCPIEEKINKAIKEAEVTIYKNINSFLVEAFDKIERDQENIVESISEYLENANITIEEPTYVEENNTIENSGTYANEEAEKIIEALKNIKTKEEPLVMEAKENVINEHKSDYIKDLIEENLISENKLSEIIDFAKLCSKETLDIDLEMAYGNRIDSKVLDTIYKNYK